MSSVTLTHYVWLVWLKALVIMSGYSGYNVVIVQKQDPKWVILVIWYGTLMLEYLFVE